MPYKDNKDDDDGGSTDGHELFSDEPQPQVTQSSNPPPPPPTVFEDELATYGRLMKYMVMVLVFWFGILFAMSHHDTKVVMVGLVLMGLWIVWMCCSILQFLVGGSTVVVPAYSSNDDEESGLTLSDMTSKMDASGNGSGIDPNAVFPFRFEDTPQRIRNQDNSDDNDTYDKDMPTITQPTNGTYKAIYSAVFFNKTIRSEGKLRLEFTHKDPNHKINHHGWNIRGESIFGREARTITDGFVTKQGKMYWKVGDTMHRGMLDQTFQLYEGEFANVDVKSGQKCPSGRIVRLELTTEASYLQVV